MTDLTRDVGRAFDEHAPGDDPAADAGPHEDAEDVAGAAPRAVGILAEGDGVDVVGELEAMAGRAGAEHPEEVDVSPAEVGGVVDDAGVATEHPGDADPDGDVGRLRGFRDDRGDLLGDHRYDRVGIGGGELPFPLRS